MATWKHLPGPKSERQALRDGFIATWLSYIILLPLVPLQEDRVDLNVTSLLDLRLQILGRVLILDLGLNLVPQTNTRLTAV